MVSFTEPTITWISGSSIPFLEHRGVTTIAQYMDWVKGGHYSAILRDGSLLQITYRLDRGDITGQRLAYIPCPVLIDEAILQEEPIWDVIDAYVGARAISEFALMSPIRFDYAPDAVADAHPAAH